MRITRQQLAQVRTSGRQLWAKKGVRVASYVAGIALAWSSGHDLGVQETKYPTDRVAPEEAFVVTPEQLHGKWDGTGTTQDGRTFCMAEWPCEDAGK